MVNRIRVVAFCLLSQLAIFLLGFSILSRLAASVLPNVDFYNVPAYRQALARSTNPAAKAIHAEIVSGPADLARAKAAAMQAGIPLTPAPMPPESENAYFAYKKWFAASLAEKAFFDGQADSLRIRFVNSPRELATDQKVIDDHPKVFALFNQATELPYYATPVGDYTGEADLREAARQTVTRAYLLAYRGHFTDAILMQERGFAIARQVGDSTSPVNYLLSATLANVTLSGMQNLLYLAGPNISDDQQVKLAVTAFHLPSQAEDVRVCASKTLALFDSHRNDSASDIPKLLQPDWDYNAPTPSPTPYSLADRQFINEYIDAVEARYLKDTCSELAQIRDHPDIVTLPAPSEPHSTAGGNSQDPIRAAMSDIEPWAWPPNVTASPAQAAASRQVTLAAAALLAAKTKTSAFPTTLPSKFTDPFNHNKPLGYHVDTDRHGFVVYSVGKNGTFDGGEPNKWYWEGSVFRFPAPPRIPYTQ